MRPHEKASIKQALGADINWENPFLYCDNCGERIESAYAEEENPE